MFKRHIGITHLPINNIFIVNNAQHAYYTRQINSLQTQIGKNEKVYKLFSNHRINIWNHMSSKNTIDVSYTCYKKYQNVYTMEYDSISNHIHIYNTLNTNPHFIFPCIPSWISHRSAGIH